MLRQLLVVMFSNWLACGSSLVDVGDDIVYFCDLPGSERMC